MSNIKISRYAAPTADERANVMANMAERGNTQEVLWESTQVAS